MVELDLNAGETAMLRDILESYLSDLRMEIADTDSMDFREDLKKREVLLKRIIETLGRGTNS